MNYHKLGLSSKFSLNRIFENEQMKFVHFRSKLSQISKQSLRLFLMNFAKISNEFCEKMLTKIFAEITENFYFHSHFRWLDETFSKEIERKLL